MYTRPNDNAYPSSYQEEYGDNGGVTTRIHEGLTIREHFAAIALQGLLTKYSLKTPEDQDTICQMAVELSDTLIKTLNK